jgi:hypothetical protein
LDEIQVLALLGRDAIHLGRDVGGLRDDGDQAIGGIGGDDPCYDGRIGLVRVRFVLVLQI